jgi:hypothetical protein
MRFSCAIGMTSFRDANDPTEGNEDQDVSHNYGILDIRDMIQVIKTVPFFSMISILCIPIQ